MSVEFKFGIKCKGCQCFDCKASGRCEDFPECCFHCDTEPDPYLECSLKPMEEAQQAIKNEEERASHFDREVK